MRAGILLAALTALAVTNARPMFLPNLGSRTQPPVSNSDTGFVPRTPHHDPRAEAQQPDATRTLEKLQPLMSNLPPAGGGAWSLDTTYDGNNFWDNNWWWFNHEDPTYGHVNYLDYVAARGKGLSWAQGGQFGIAVESKTAGMQNGRGRDSVRIQTTKGFGQSIMVFDVEHMPVGCGTFPALWTIGQGKDWPDGGEVDIIEGSNNDWGKAANTGSPARENLITLHTSHETGVTDVNKKCRMAENWGDNFSGAAIQGNCSNTNGGCNVQPNDEYAYGNKFNENKGGWYVVRRNADSFAFWFFRRDADKVPDSIKNGGQTVTDADLEGFQMMAEFGGQDRCDGPSLMERFTKQEIIINISLGGRDKAGNLNWGGKDFDEDQSCHKDQWKDKVENFIDTNPGAFTEAYWLFNSIRIYTNGKED